MQQIIKLDTTKKDTVKKTGKNNSSLDQKVEYKAEDSVKMSADKSIVYLYGNARVIYGDFELDASYIEYNKKLNTIFAKGLKDPKTGRYAGRPIFKSGNDGTAIADSIFYNSETTKAKVYGVFSEQEGGFFSGGQSKKQIDDELHIKNVMYSTCNLPHPHFGLMISKGVVTEKQIITGPVYMIIEDIPTFLGLPFAFFPKQNKRTSGVILPTPGEDATRGFFLQNGGYYLGLNDYWDAKLMGSIYTNGSYETSVLSNYTKRYKYSGNINVSYASFKDGLEGTEAFANPTKNFSINWSHSQNANANPGTTFSASVRLVSTGRKGYYKNTAAGASYDINTIATNSTSSSVSYAKAYSNGMNFSLAASSDQTLSTRAISLRLPELTFNVPTFNPFSSKTAVGEQKWYQKITVGYSLQGTNRIDTFDSLLFQNDGLKRLRSGFSHSIPVNMSFTALKYLNFSLGGTYNEVWNFQSVNRRYTSYADNTYSFREDTVSGFKRAGSYSLSTSLSTKIYGRKDFNPQGKIQALRHVMTPNVSFSYSPDFTKAGAGPYRPAIDQNGRPIVITGVPLKYSIFDGMAQPGSFGGPNASIGFGLDNTVELKVRNKNDTTGTGSKKIPIIQGLSFSGSYNFLATRYKLSTIGFSGRSQFTDKLGINYNGTLDPYALTADTIPGSSLRIRQDRYFWQAGKFLPRLTNFGFSFDYSLNPEALKRKNEANDKLGDAANKKGLTDIQSEQLAAISRDPNAFVDFNIPWNFSFAYSFQYTNDGNNTNVSNTLTFNGDVNLTPKWKVTFQSGYDFKNNGLTPMNLGIYRDLHCWDMNVTWVPFGLYKSYTLTIKVKASILQDLKLSKRQGFYSTYR
ncbi:putative LPS assembly protein LptD [Pedobacter sp. UBA5917]|uniref:putative LPS assembly protein LptD n=1 Tax=Pedobacter sp. UBA5917 TaxID=1947061 RepID=UPI0025F99191|nr:putative LPS assembly protein LptD [Pedobacter sp. UBA5917]